MNPSDTPKTLTLDVRPLLVRDEEPFKKIMLTVAGLKPAENLMLIAPFLPSPLIEKLRSEGFTAHPERVGDGSWRTLFIREKAT